MAERGRIDIREWVSKVSGDGRPAFEFAFGARAFDILSKGYLLICFRLTKTILTGAFPPRGIVWGIGSSVG